MTENNGKVSEFNEAFLIVRRIHELKQLSNFCSLDPLAPFTGNGNFNQQFGSGKKNYEIMFSADSARLGEIISKLSNKERNNPDKQGICDLRDFIKEFMIKYPVIEYERSPRSNKHSETINKKNWEKLDKLLVIFQTNVNCLADKHGFSTPDKSDPNFAIGRS